MWRMRWEYSKTRSEKPFGRLEAECRDGKDPQRRAGGGASEVSSGCLGGDSHPPLR